LKSRHFTTYSGLPKEIYILFWARIINCMGSFILPLLTLILTQKLGLSKTETGNFSALLTLTQAPSLLLGGKLVDAIGRKKILITCQVLGSVSYLLCGIVNNHTAMIVFIVIASNLFVAASPAYQAMVADLTAPENRKASFSLLYLGINIGMTISPLLGGLLFQDHLSLLFILDAATTLASSFLIAVFIKETKNGRQKHTATGGAPADNASVFHVLKAMPILLLFIVFMSIYDFTYTQWNFMLPLQFGDLYNVNGARFFSILTALNSLIVIMFTPLLTHLTMKFRSLVVISGGGVLFFLSFVIFGLAKSLPLFLAAGAIFTFGEIVVTIHSGTFIADHSPSAHLGRINSISMFMQGTARALSPLVMGYVLSMTSYFIAWSSIAAFMLIGATSILLLNKKSQKQSIQAAGQESTV